MGDGSEVSVIRNDEKLSNCTDMSWETVRKVSVIRNDEKLSNCTDMSWRRFGK